MGGNANCAFCSSQFFPGIGNSACAHLCDCRRSVFREATRVFVQQSRSLHETSAERRPARFLPFQMAFVSQSLVRVNICRITQLNEDHQTSYWMSVDSFSSRTLLYMLMYSFYFSSWVAIRVPQRISDLILCSERRSFFS